MAVGGSCAGCAGVASVDLVAMCMALVLIWRVIASVVAVVVAVVTVVVSVSFFEHCIFIFQCFDGGFGFSESGLFLSKFVS